MSKQKYDYAALKKEFIDSDFDEVKSFITHKGLTYSAERARRTKGRTKEKQAHKAEIVEDAIKKSVKKKAEELSVPIEDLMKGKKAIIGLLLQQVKKYVDESKNEKGEIQNLDVGNAERILKMFKTELGEPSTIGTNYNLNANKVEGLTEEESEALDILFGKSQNGKKSKE